MKEKQRKPKVTILVGLPRSGKSTYAKNLGLPILSADQLRYLVYGQRFWKEGEDFVWAIREIVLKMLLEQGVSFVVDETNTIRKYREILISRIREYGYIVEFIIIPTTKEECLKRALAEDDEYIVPVIERMAEHYEAVGEDEADQIIVLDQKG